MSKGVLDSFRNAVIGESQSDILKRAMEDRKKNKDNFLESAPDETTANAAAKKMGLAPVTTTGKASGQEVKNASLISFKGIGDTSKSKGAEQVAEIKKTNIILSQVARASQDTLAALRAMKAPTYSIGNALA
jgi:hypothetical protein